MSRNLLFSLKHSKRQQQLSMPFGNNSSIITTVVNWLSVSILTNHVIFFRTPSVDSIEWDRVVLRENLLAGKFHWDFHNLWRAGALDVINLFFLLLFLPNNKRKTVLLIIRRSFSLPHVMLCVYAKKRFPICKIGTKLNNSGYGCSMRSESWLLRSIIKASFFSLSVFTQRAIRKRSANTSAACSLKAHRFRIFMILCIIFRIMFAARKVAQGWLKNICFVSDQTSFESRRLHC